MSSPTIVWGRYCLPEPGQVWADAGVLVRDGRIVAAGPVSALRAQAPGAPELGGPMHCCTPGLVDAHSHGNGADAASRGIPDAPLEPWIHALAGGPSLDPWLDVLWADVQKLEAGVTTMLHHAYERDAGALDRIADAHRAAGLRVCLALGISDRNRLVHDDEAGALAALPEDLRALARELAGVKLGDGVAWLDLADSLRARHEGPRLRVGLGPSGPHWCSEALWERVAERSARDGSVVHTHAAESPREATQARRAWGCSVVAHLGRLGVLSPRCSLAHVVWTEPGDAELLAEAGVTVVHAPGSNLRLQNGVAPMPALRQAGVALALGTDDTTLASDHDLLGEARLAWRLHRPALPAEAVWGMATTGGARVCGFGPGTLTPGAPADCVLWWLESLQAPLPATNGALLPRLLARGRASAVDIVLVDGAVVVSGGRHVSPDRDDWEDEWRTLLVRAPRRHRLAAAAALLWPHLERFYAGW